MIRRIVIAAAALLAGFAVAAGLLIYDRGGQAAGDVYVAATDLPAGAHLAGPAVKLVRAGLWGRQAALAYRAGEETRLSATDAAHDLAAGQVIQRPDTVPAGRESQRALVVLPLKDAPVLQAGDRVDLLMLTGTGENTTVSLFAPAVQVHAVVAGGVVLDVGVRQAAGFVYAAAALRIVAMRVNGGARADEAPVASSQQALVVARR